MKMKKMITTLFAALTLVISVGVSAADSKSCQTACGMSFGKCIQANPDGYETACTPKRDVCIASCEKQTTQVVARSAKFAPRSIAAPSKASLLFMEAFTNKNYEMMDVFLQQGADINCENCRIYHDFYTPLMWMGKNPLYYSGGLAMVDYLLARGADVNYQNKDGITAMMLSLSRPNNAKGMSSFEFRTKLIQAGANVNLADRLGNKAIHYLAQNNVVKNDTYKHLDTFQEWLQSLKLLLANGANLNEKNGKGMTPLMVQSDTCNLATSEALLSLGADPTIKSPLGATALSLATETAAKTRQDSSCNQLVRLLSNPSSAKEGVSMAEDSPDTKAKPASNLLDSLKKLNESMKKLGQQ